MKFEQLLFILDLLLWIGLTKQKANHIFLQKVRFYIMLCRIQVETQWKLTAVF